MMTTFHNDRVYVSRHHPLFKWACQQLGIADDRPFIFLMEGSQLLDDLRSEKTPPKDLNENLKS